MALGVPLARQCPDQDTYEAKRKASVAAVLKENPKAAVAAKTQKSSGGSPRNTKQSHVKDKKWSPKGYGRGRD